jgi:hypothetical protein
MGSHFAAFESFIPSFVLALRNKTQHANTLVLPLFLLLLLLLLL